MNDTVEKNTNKLMALNETVVDQEGQMEQITTYFLSIQVRNHISPSLNTQCCIKGLLVVRDFWATPELKKKFGANYEQLLRAYFSFFGDKGLRKFSNLNLHTA